MKVFKDYSTFDIKGDTAVSIGMFDGVHLAHQYIIKSLVEESKKRGLYCVLFTFDTHPKLFFNPNCDLKYLTLYQEKIQILEKLGVDAVVFQTFDKEFSQLTGEDFISEVLVQNLRAKHISIGYNHVFGNNRSGDFHLLQNLAKKYHYTLEQTTSVIYNGEPVSSTNIRSAIVSGDVIKANNMLGYKYSLSGKVIHGKKNGRKIGYPTANICVSKNKLLPKFGAYIVEVFVKNKLFAGMLSIGNNPTFDGDEISVEVYILDFEGDIYGEEIIVGFRDFLHEQIKFSSVEQLIVRLDEDKNKTIDFFNNNTM